MLHLCVHHPAHAPFMVGKLWDYFAGVPLRGSTRAHLVRVYRRSGFRIRPVVGAILRTRRSTGTSTRPTWSSRPSSTWPGRCARPARASTAIDWTWLLDSMGQFPFRPPSVAGWEWGTSWLSSNSMRVRFDFANYMLDTRRVGVKDGSTPNSLSPRKAVARAKRAVGDPWTSARDRPRAAAHRPPRRSPTTTSDERGDMCQRALRHLLISGPDAQVH